MEIFNIMEPLFIQNTGNEDPVYRRIRDDSDVIEIRRKFDSLWNEYNVFAPKGFQKKLQIEFNQRWWEMFLSVGLLHLGLNVKTNSQDKGPDIFLQMDSTTIWIEAVAPKAGISSDKVPPPIISGTAKFPKRECLLRFAQGLVDKQKKYSDYFQNGITKTSDVCIIAISTSGLNHYGYFLDFPCPAALSILAGAGDLVVSPDGSFLPYCEHQQNVTRDSGSPVSTALFVLEEFKMISGVLYSRHEPISFSSRPEESFQLFLNPHALNPVPESFFQHFKTWQKGVNAHSDTQAIWKSHTRKRVVSVLQNCKLQQHIA